MKAVAYSVKLQEKAALAIANEKKHDLTLISNELNAATIAYAQGKDVAIVSTYDIVDHEMLKSLKRLGVSKLITRSNTLTHIDLKAAAEMAFNIANIPHHSIDVAYIAEQVVRHLNLWGSGQCVGEACCCKKGCNLKLSATSEAATTLATNNPGVQ